MALLQSDVAAIKQHVASAAPASPAIETEDLIKLIEHLQELILATGDTETINLWLDEAIGDTPASAADIQGLDWNIERLIAAAQALAQSERQSGPPLLRDARAELLAATGDERFKPLASWSEIIAALPAGERALELIALFGTHQALLDAPTHAERLAIAALLVHGSADTDGDGRIEAHEVAPADRLDFLNGTGAYAATQGGAHDIDLRFAGAAAQELLAGDGVVAGAADGTADGAGSADDAGKSAPVSSGAAVADIGSPTDPAAAGDDQASGPAVDARLQFVRLGLDGRAVDNDGSALVANVDSSNGLFLIGGAEADSLTGGAGDDTIAGNAGNDRLAGGAGNDAIAGGDGGDVVSGGSGADLLSGDAGNDLILGGAGADRLDGGDGDDILDAGADGATVEGGAGDDVLLLGESDLAASGGDGNDIVVAAGGNTSASGGQGFDWISFTSPHVSEAAAAQSFEGQSGSDDADHLIAGHAGAADAGAASQAIDGLAAYLEEIGAGDAAFDFTGSILLGGAGSDTLQGSSGNDLIDGDLSLSIRIKIDNSGEGNRADDLSIDSLEDLSQSLLSGEIEIDQVSISSTLSNSGRDGDVDTVRFSGRRGEYDIAVSGSVTTVIHHLVDSSGAILVGSIGQDGMDRLTNVERLEFSDQMLVLDFAGMSWVIDGDGDMFVFASEPGMVPILADPSTLIDLSVLDQSYISDSVQIDLVGVYDMVQADYAIC